MSRWQNALNATDDLNKYLAEEKAKLEILLKEYNKQVAKVESIEKQTDEQNRLIKEETKFRNS